MTDFAIEHAGDEMIVIGAQTTLGTYYRLGNKVTVRVGGNHFLCLTCSSPDRYETPDHKGCSHISRVKRYIAEHSEGAAA